jgi:plasmid stability protein
MTTIRVEAEVRDRLAALAATHSRSLDAELRAMLDEMMCRYRSWLPKTGSRPEEMAAHHAEIAGWTSAGLGDLAATVAGEYPEYNS